MTKEKIWNPKDGDYFPETASLYVYKWKAKKMFSRYDFIFYGCTILLVFVLLFVLRMITSF